MNGPIVVDITLPVGISLAFAVDEVILETLPALMFCVVRVHEELALAGFPTPIEEY
jgi:hypothetical protein